MKLACELSGQLTQLPLLCSGYIKELKKEFVVVIVLQSLEEYIFNLYNY